jgi:TRAP-type mannitol/chloroaromatic compound transport system substrate-binding protein
MKKWMVGSSVAGAFAFLLAVGASTPTLAADPIKWRVQTGVAPGGILFQTVERFANHVDSMSGGRLKTEVLPVGAVVGFFEIMDAVDQGLVEGGMQFAHFFSGKHPASYLFADQPTIGGMDQFTYLSWFAEGGGNDLYQQLLDEELKANIIAFVMLMSGGQPLGWFEKPLHSLADFQKLKYRSPPGLTGELFTLMGISAVALPGAELIPSAQKGIIDGGEWLMPGEDIKLGLYQVWKHYYLQGFHQASDFGSLIVNKDFWNSLTPDLQAIIRISAQASIVDSITISIHQNGVALEELKSKHGVQIHETPPDLYPAFAKASKQLVKKYSAQNAFFKKVVESQQDFAKITVPYWTDLLGLYHSLGKANQ